MDCSPPGSSVRGIFQARVLEWVAIPFSRGSCWPRDQTLVSCIVGRFFTSWATSAYVLFFFLPKRHALLFFSPSSSILKSYPAQILLLLWNFCSAQLIHQRNQNIRNPRPEGTWNSSGPLFSFYRWESRSQQPSVRGRVFLPSDSHRPWAPALLTYREHVLSLWLVCKLLEARAVSSSSWRFSACRVHLP